MSWKSKVSWQSKMNCKSELFILNLDLKRWSRIQDCEWNSSLNFVDKGQFLIWFERDKSEVQNYKCKLINFNLRMTEWSLELQIIDSV